MTPPAGQRWTRECHHHCPRLVSVMCLECARFLSDDEVEPGATGMSSKTIRGRWAINPLTPNEAT
jgi:hypothetical protein